MVINKVDRPTSRVNEVETEILDLFLTLEASESQLDYPLVYASAKEGWVVTEWPAKEGDSNDRNMNSLFDLIVKHVPPPQADPSSPFSMLVTQLESDAYVGKCYLGRVSSGTIRVGDPLKAIDEKGKQTDSGRVLKLFQRNGTDRVSVEEACAGDIVTVAGLTNASVNSTLCHLTVKEPIQVRRKAFTMLHTITKTNYHRRLFPSIRQRFQ